MISHQRRNSISQADQSHHDHRDKTILSSLWNFDLNSFLKLHRKFITWRMFFLIQSSPYLSKVETFNYTNRPWIRKQIKVDDKGQNLEALWPGNQTTGTHCRLYVTSGFFKGWKTDSSFESSLSAITPKRLHAWDALLLSRASFWCFVFLLYTGILTFEPVGETLKSSLSNFKATEKCFLWCCSFRCTRTIVLSNFWFLKSQWLFMRNLISILLFAG